MELGYVYVWEFQVRAEMAAAFELHYGPDGTWARLFRNSSEYIETLLLKDAAAPGRYLTVDRWRSEEAHHAFLAAYAAQYERLDQECEHLTVSERSLGTFNQLPPDGSFTPAPLRGPA